MLAPVSCGMRRAGPLHGGRQVVVVPVGVLWCGMGNSDKHIEPRLCLFVTVVTFGGSIHPGSSAVQSNVGHCCVM